MRKSATAACFRDDAVAAFALARLADGGVRVPEHLTVTGFDGIELGSAFRVGLTTLRVPVREMVARVQRILATWPSGRRHRFDMELLLRGSHGPAPARAAKAR